MKLHVQKRLAASVLKRSKKKISLDSTRLEEIKEAITQAVNNVTSTDIVSKNGPSGKFYSPLVRSIAEKENISMAELESTEKVLRRVAKDIFVSIEKEYWPAKPSRLCDWCYFKSICPAHNS